MPLTTSYSAFQSDRASSVCPVITFHFGNQSGPGRRLHDPCTTSNAGLDFGGANSQCPVTTLHWSSQSSGASSKRFSIRLNRGRLVMTRPYTGGATASVASPRALGDDANLMQRFEPHWLEAEPMMPDARDDASVNEFPARPRGATRGESQVRW